MSIYLGLSKRYRAALETFDPLCGDPLMRLVDPWPSKGRNGEIPWRRVALSLALLLGPQWLFSAIPSSTFGRGLLGKGGIAADVGLYAINLFLAFALVLIPVVRRILGDLPAELERRGLLNLGQCKVRSLFTPKGRPLRFLACLSRTSGRCGLIWYGLLLANQLGVYALFLADGRVTWQSSPSFPGSLFYPLRIGARQPNLAGLWSFVVMGPVGLFLVVVISRLIVSFACLCAGIARSRGLTILPVHPDGTGGLQPIGQVALLFSLFAFVLGLDLAGMTLNEEMGIQALSPGVPHHLTNLHLLYFMWGLYLLLGSVLFFLPLLPLRARMAEAKRTYLMGILRLHATVGLANQSEILQRIPSQKNMEKLAMLEPLIRSASEMAVWPYDRKTFLRYASLFLSPLIPVIVDQLRGAVYWIESWKGVAP